MHKPLLGRRLCDCAKCVKSRDLERERHRRFYERNAERRNPKMTERKKQARIALRRALLARDGELCAWCSEPLGDILDAEEVHVDHIIPRADGGGGSRDSAEPHPNLRLLHGECNREKGARLERVPF